MHACMHGVRRGRVRVYVVVCVCVCVCVCISVCVSIYSCMPWQGTVWIYVFHDTSTRVQVGAARVIACVPTHCKHLMEESFSIQHIAGVIRLPLFIPIFEAQRSRRFHDKSCRQNVLRVGGYIPCKVGWKCTVLVLA